MRTFASNRNTFGKGEHSLRSQRPFADRATVRRSPAPPVEASPASPAPAPKPMSIYPPDGSVQRYAFVNNALVDKDQQDLTPKEKSMAADNVIRDYESPEELKSHSIGGTDYLGNLKDGTWVRFSSTGINLLGEDHTAVNFLEVGPAVGAKSFIYEPLASDDMAGAPELKKVYEAESLERFKTLGIDKEEDKKKYGAESLFPKIGYAFTRALSYLKDTQNAKKLRTGKDYIGQPIQRYLKIAWGHSKDNLAEVKAKELLHEAVPPMRVALALAHEKLAADLDPLIVPLPLEGYIGDVLGNQANAKFLEPVNTFIRAYLDALEELAKKEKRLDAEPQKEKNDDDNDDDNQRYVDSDDEDDEPEDPREKMFSAWRDLSFADNVARAKKQGVRYAGMGQFHLDELKKKKLADDEHPYEMDGEDLRAFKKLTKKLRKAATEVK